MSFFTYIFAATEETPECRLIKYTRSQFENDWASVEHCHPYCEILYVFSGEGVYRQGERTAPLRQGTLAIINPYKKHTEFSSCENPVDYAVFSVDQFSFAPQRAPDNFDETETAADDDDFFLFDLSAQHAYFCDAALTFARELHDKKPYADAYLQNVFRNVLLTVLRETALTASPARTENNKHMQIPVAVADYLEKYYVSPITLDTLAERFYINKFYLVRIFKEAFGVTPKQYLNKVRIRGAQTLLASTDFSVISIANMVGFVNASHFTRLFKRYTGKTPSQVVQERYRSSPRR